MTRFARAKGSKASNERLPEQATPWSLMRSQLQQDVDRQENASDRAKFETMRKENYENFLKERAAEKTVKTWCSFEENGEPKESKDFESNSTIKKNKSSKKLKVKKQKLLSKPQSAGDQPQLGEDVHSNHSDSNESNPEITKEIDTWLDEHTDQEMENKYTNITSQLNSILKSNKKDKKNNSKIDVRSENTFTVTSLKPAQDEKVKNQTKTKNKKRKHEMIFDNNDFNPSDSQKKTKKSIDSSSEIFVESDNSKIANKVREESLETITSKKSQINSSTSSESIVPHKKKKSKSVQNLEDKKNYSDVMNSDDNSNCKASKTSDKQNKKKQKEKSNFPENPGKISKVLSKSVNSSDFKNSEKTRRKPQNNDKSILIVNGEQLEVTNFDGFPILSKDAERLQDLRKNLISKGIPRSEVMRTLKLERRKAEKSLSRMKKKLCFHCRKGGHNLSECPELTQKNEIGAPSSGICFKCGSTEHTHFACKVVRTQDYKFAQCFICKEQGHISRQCPDNPRGLYPKGGGCRECGDVTHLKKDCPKIVQQKEDTSIKLDLMDSSNVEGAKKSAFNQHKNSSVKHIKF